MTDVKNHCDGKAQGRYPCSSPAAFRVEWRYEVTQQFGWFNLRRVERKACAHHLTQIVRQGLPEAFEGDIHVLAVGSRWDWIVGCEVPDEGNR